MHLIELFLPLHDNEGRPFPRQLFDDVRRELTERFGGMTSHSRAPAEGLWQDDSSQPTRDEIVIFEVMAEEIDRDWWRAYRAELEVLLRQEKLIVRASRIELI
jgi:hypothetical protein